MEPRFQFLSRWPSGDTPATWRFIQKEIETAVARLMLKGEIKDGQTIVVDYDADRGALKFMPKTVEPKQRKAS